MKKINLYEVKRKMIMYFAVEATSKKEALEKVEDANRIDIISEKIKLIEKNIRQED